MALLFLLFATTLERSTKMIRKLLCGVAVAMLTGCGTASSVKFAAVQMPTKMSFVFRDERPLEQKSPKNIESASGSTVIYGDESLAPPFPQLLAASLQEKLGDRLTGKTVSLTSLVIKVSDQGVTLDTNALNSAVASTPGGYAAAPLSMAIILGIEKMRGHRMVSVEVAGKVDDVPFSSWVSDHRKGSISEQDLRSTLTRALETTIFEVMRKQEETQNER